jgi:hypothetical protein
MSQELERCRESVLELAREGLRLGTGNLTKEESQDWLERFGRATGFMMAQEEIERSQTTSGVHGSMPHVPGRPNPVQVMEAIVSSLCPDCLQLIQRAAAGITFESPQ